MSATQRKQALRHDIMNVIKANNLEVTGDFWLMLIFRTESELKKNRSGFSHQNRLTHPRQPAPDPCYSVRVQRSFTNGHHTHRNRTGTS
jgi:hypothetical protein